MICIQCVRDLHESKMVMTHTSIKTEEELIKYMECGETPPADHGLCKNCFENPVHQTMH